MPRIVFDGNEKSNKELQQLAEDLDLSQIKALQLAIAVLARLSDEIGKGAELVLREASGKEVNLWLPHLRDPSVPSTKKPEEK